MLIRQVREHEKEKYNGFFLEGIRSSPECFRITPGEALNRPFSVELSRDRAVFVATIGDDWIGTASFERDLTRIRRSHVGWLVRMYVHPSFRGRGIASELGNSVVRYAAELRDIDHLNVTVMQSNQDALSVYLRMGFVQIGEETDAVQHGELFLNELILSKKL
jgi:GNAT superfamily N-acetyltransferase